MQKAQQEEAVAIEAADLMGKDALDELKQMAAGACSKDQANRNGNALAAASSAQIDLRSLLRDAAEGISVAGRAPTWEAGRPGILPLGEPVKARGFIDYSRYISLASHVSLAGIMS